jgi:hypothetical protein
MGGTVVKHRALSHAQYRFVADPVTFASLAPALKMALSENALCITKTRLEMS